MCVALLACAGSRAAAAETAPEPPGADKEMPAEAPKEPMAAPRRAELPVPKERSSVTHHQVKMGDAVIDYTATAGTLLIRKGEDPVASIFYVAYTRDGVKDMQTRPVTFFYNGGPGSSTLWLHMGSFGPRVVETANAEPTGSAPYHLVNNPDSLLDRSDLVFIDAVSTGFSRIVGKGEGKDFWNVDGDVEAFGKFITRYVTVNHRWDSPKFLFGESYGTLRSAALAYHLQEQGMYLNGVVLLSSVLSYDNLISPSLDEPYVNILPTYAAIAWYHDKLPHKPADLPAFLQQVRDFASGEYAQALAKGQTLPDAQIEAIAARLHELTGLGVQFLKDSNLRVRPARFRKELLRDERRTLGRYDGRFEGTEAEAAGDMPTLDPSETSIKGAFTAAFYSYLADELDFSHETPYQVSSAEFSYKDWDFKHKLPDASGAAIPFPLAYVVDDLGQAMRMNTHLKVLSANGYFDLATPFFGTERDLYHMELDASLRDNLSIRYYPSGHMVYLNPDAHRQFRADLGKFYDSAAPQ